MRKPAPNARKPLQDEAVDDRAHAVLADAEVEVAARVGAVLDVAAAVDQRQRRGREVGGAADQLGHLRGRPLDHLLEALRVAIMPASGPLLGHVGVPAVGQPARR